MKRRVIVLLALMAAGGGLGLHIPTRGFTSDGTRLRIADAGGVTVFDAPLETRGDAVALNVSNLAPGMYVYYIVAVEGRTVASGKFMKE